MLTDNTFSQNTRAASSVISVILLVGIVILGIGMIGALGYTSITEQTQAVSTDSVFTQFERIDSTIASLTETSTKQASLNIDFGPELSVASVSENSGELTVSKGSSTPDGFENPSPSDCTLTYGDTNLPDRPQYVCTSDLTQSSKVSASITNFELVRSFGGGPPVVGGSPARNNAEIEVDVTSSVSGGESFDGGRPSEVILYDSSGTELDRKDVSASGSETIRFPNVANDESYIVDIVVFATDGDSSGERVYADGYGSAPSTQPDYLVPGIYSYPPTVTLYGTVELGEIYLDMTGNTRMVYQGGAVIEQQDSGQAAMRKPPEFSVRPSSSRADTVSLPFVLIDAGDNTALSSYTTFRKTQSDSVYDERYLDTDEVITIELTSQYADAWAKYFEETYGDESYASVSQTGSKVTLRIGENTELYIQSRADTLEVSG